MAKNVNLDQSFIDKVPNGYISVICLENAPEQLFVQLVSLTHKPAPRVWRSDDHEAKVQYDERDYKIGERVEWVISEVKSLVHYKPAPIFAENVLRIKEKVLGIPKKMMMWIVVSAGALFIGGTALAGLDQYGVLWPGEMMQIISVNNIKNIITGWLAEEDSNEKFYKALNNHPFYQSEFAKEIETETKIILKKRFWYIGTKMGGGDQYFVMREVARDPGTGKILIYNRSAYFGKDAEDYCEGFGGNLLTTEQVLKAAESIRIKGLQEGEVTVNSTNDLGAFRCGINYSEIQ